MRDQDLFTMAPDLDTYVYLVFLRMSLWFFVCLAAINALVVMPIYSTGSAQAHHYKTILPRIQQITIANVIGDDNRLFAGFAFGCLNWGLLCVFIAVFKKKVDTASSTYNLNKYEVEEVMIAG